MSLNVADLTIGKGILSWRAFTSAPIAWAASTAVTLGQYVLTADNKLYVVTDAGTTGSTAPTATTAAITDGTAELDYVNWVDLGNAPAMAVSTESDTVDHYDSRGGIRTRDLQVVTARRVGGSFTLDEMSLTTLSIALAGEVTGTGIGASVEILSLPQLQGQLKLTQAQDVGTRYEYFFGYVKLETAAEIPLIQDQDFAQVEVNFSVNQDANGVYGTATRI